MLVLESYVLVEATAVLGWPFTSVETFTTVDVATEFALLSLFMATLKVSLMGALMGWLWLPPCGWLLCT